MTIATSRNKHYLFGFPISHSHSPGFQNEVFASLSLPNRYILREAETVDDPAMLELLRSPDHAGSAVTMPLKVAAMRLMDRVTEEAKVIGSINTVYLEEGEAGQMKLVGTNTDWVRLNSRAKSLWKELTRTRSSWASATLWEEHSTQDRQRRLAQHSSLAEEEQREPAFMRSTR